MLKFKEKGKWVEAMEDEMESLEANDTWELTPLPAGKKAIGCKWVYKLKTSSDGTVQRYKARLVAQGFSQKYGDDYDQVFAPVVKQSTTRILLSLAAKLNLCVRHFDVKTAFLNGDLEEEIFMKQPPGFISDKQPDHVCRLKRSLYGLKQAARSWNQKLTSLLVEFGFVQGKADSCLYKLEVPDGICYVIVYVDDLIVASNLSDVIKKLKGFLDSNFETEDLGDIKCYVGVSVEKDAIGNYVINQTKYIEKIIEEFGLSDGKTSAFPLDPGYGKNEADTQPLPDNKNYQRLIGSLLYLSVNSRPDISASVSILAQKVCGPTKQDWEELKRILRYLKGTVNLKLKLSDLKGKDHEEICGWADANWAENHRDKKSNSGYVFKICGGTVSWCCRKQDCVALSSTEAEFIALSEACQEAGWIKNLLSDMGIELKKPMKIFEDNQSVLKLIKEENLSKRTKHIETKKYFVKDYVEKKIVACEYCPTEVMIADLLTKPLNGVKIKQLRELCGIIPSEEEC
jgi:hypothetical protein